MKKGFDFDGALKEVFQQDRPTLLQQLTRGVAIQAFLNVELPRVQQRRVDLVLSLRDGTILHIELQSTADRFMAYRMLEYWTLIKRRFGRPLRQVVLYVGTAKPAITNRLEEDELRFGYGVMDIREIEADALLTTGNHGDLALAVLAGGGGVRLREILRQAASVKGSRRDRLAAQILILSGLRGIAGKVEWELKHMGVVIDITKNPVLMRWRREAITEGRAEGMSRVLRELIDTKFGPPPKWALDRLAKAKPAQLERWARKVLTAGTLEGVLGKN